MIDWLSVIINILLLIVTIGTVAYANKTLHMEYSSQVIVRRYVDGYNRKRYYPIYWKVAVKNVGKGYIVKAFILLSVRQKKLNMVKLHYLSRPIAELHPDEERELLLELRDEELEKGHFEKAKLEVIYQDTLGNLYAVKAKRKKGWNTHLETFDKLPKRMSKFGFKYWVYLMKLKIAAKQGNTSPGRLKREMDRIRHPFEKGFKFEPIDKEDTK
ncbi:hypothetical protein [Oceanobacillus profundus]|uniref:hypothetical protein n=1 Tax=Oceanobacillus TaxID=182709 RepID=UPI0026E3C1B6|nr:hypothetical protein [Oceanobacillus profundus]MDO6448082.1 hypothetical protein [Oceanobacillus profundus]